MDQGIDPTIFDRKPARKLVDVPADVRRLLAQGKIETKNLTEWLAVDRLELLRNLTKELPVDSDALDWVHLESQAEQLAALKFSRVIAAELSKAFEVTSEAWKLMSTHTSDIAREWAALTLGLSSMPFQKKLAWIKPIADAPNSGLREVAWMALRNDVDHAPEEAVKRLVPWTGSRSPNLRRYASEITRPRGVWTQHIEAFKNRPEIAIEILEALKKDDTKYVKDSVANWLNDASKSQPEWVMQITDRWLKESDSKHTQAIVHRALRTLRKLSETLRKESFWVEANC